MFGFLLWEEVIAETFPEQYNYVYANLPQKFRFSLFSNGRPGYRKGLSILQD